MRVSDDDALLLRPRFALAPQTVRRELESIPGAFQHPTESNVWVLPSVAAMSDDIKATIEREPNEPTYTTQVRDKSPVSIAVFPGGTDLGAGRARKFVGALLAHGPFDLEVRGKPLGEVKSLEDIYGDAQWIDPDFTTDPTEAPPRTGTLITFYRDQRDGICESLAIHDSGVLSYEQGQPVQDSQKTYRRLAPPQQTYLRELIAALPFLEEPGAGPDGEYVDPAFISFETPTGAVHIAKLDVSNPAVESRAFVELVDGWMKALRADRAARPVGLTELDP